jgi:FkbM family methyltransferase
MRAVRTIAGSDNSVVLLAKRLTVAAVRRMDLIAPARLKSGDVLYVDLANRVGRTIWLRGDYINEIVISDLIQANLKIGDVFLDVGANVGFFSLMAARKVGESGEVHAFEPLPKLASLLRRTIATNRLENSYVVEAAVGTQSGTAQMAVMKDSAVSHLLGGLDEIETIPGGREAVLVETISLDEYRELRIRKPLRLIKMDIEGAELEAIDGARRLLSDPNGPDVICEVYSGYLARFGHEPNDIFQRFNSMGYTALDPETGHDMGLQDLSVHRQNVFFKKLKS